MNLQKQQFSREITDEHPTLIGTAWNVFYCSARGFFTLIGMFTITLTILFQTGFFTGGVGYFVSHPQDIEIMDKAYNKACKTEKDNENRVLLSARYWTK